MSDPTPLFDIIVILFFIVYWLSIPTAIIRDSIVQDKSIYKILKEGAWKPTLIWLLFGLLIMETYGLI